MRVLGWDTATRATAVALLDTDTGAVEQERDDPPAGARPEHSARLLPGAEAVLARAGLTWAGVDLLACGVGPGSFTGLRIGVAAARGAAQARALPLAGVSTLAALAAGAAAGAAPPGPVLAVLDARRGEAFAAAWGADGAVLLAPGTLAPEAWAERVAALPAGPLAVGDGAVRFRAQLQAAGAAVPEDASPLHRVSAEWICRLAARAGGADPATVLPHYIRPPDARPRRDATRP